VHHSKIEGFVGGVCMCVCVPRSAEEQRGSWAVCGCVCVGVCVCVCVCVYPVVWKGRKVREPLQNKGVRGWCVCMCVPRNAGGQRGSWAIPKGPARA